MEIRSVEISNYLLNGPGMPGIYAATLWRLMRQTVKTKGHDENLQMEAFIFN